MSIQLFRFTGRVATIAVALVVCILPAQSPGQGAEPAELKPVVLQLKWKHQFQFAGYYAALERGYYRDAGIDVQIREPAEDEDPASVVLSGKAQFGVGTSDLVLLRAKGEPVVLLACIFQHSPLVFLVPKRSGIDSIHGLSGRRVAFEKQAAELLAYLKHEGLAETSIIRVPHPFTPQPLIDGQIDAMSAYSTDEPFLLRQRGLEYLVFNPRAGGIDFYGDSLFTTEEVLTADPKLVRAFTEASLKGWKYACANPEEMVDLIYTKYSQRHSREHLRFEAIETTKLILPDIVELGYVNEGRLRYIGETYHELGLLDRVPDLEGFVVRREAGLNMRRVYTVLGSLTGLLIVVGAAFLRFGQLNGRLKRQVAERELVEKELRVAQERWRGLVEQAPFPIAITDAHSGAILFLNKRAAAALNSSQEEALGRPTRSFYENPQDRERLLGELARVGVVDAAEVRLRRTDGSVFWALISLSPVQFEGVPAVLASLMDITRRVEAEVEAETSQGHLRAVTDAIPCLVLRLTTHLRVTFANTLVENWSGVPRDKLIGRELGVAIPVGDPTILREVAARALTGEFVEIEIGVISVEGVKPVLLRLTPVSLDGAVIALFAVGVPQG